MATKKDIEKVIATAEKYIGTTSKNNDVLFNTAYYGHEVSGADYPWCVVFQWYIFHEAGLSKYFFNGAKVASCSALRKYHEPKGQVVYGDYQRGDLLLFDFSGKKSCTQHIGICLENNGKTAKSLDGNTSSTSEDNGGTVNIRERELKYVTCAIRWWKAVPSRTYTTAYAPVLKKNDSGSPVDVLQFALKQRGYYTDTIDASFGDNTVKAVKAFQKAQGITQSGKTDKKTWEALLKGD